MNKRIIHSHEDNSCNYAQENKDKSKSEKNIHVDEMKVKLGISYFTLFSLSKLEWDKIDFLLIEN